MYSYKNYLISSIPGYIFYIMQRDKENISPNTNKCVGGYYYVSTHRSYLLKLISFLLLDMNSQFKLFIDAVGSDYPSKKERFYVHYNLLSIMYGLRVFVGCSVTELDRIPSLTTIYPAASWYEREVWDMFGIHFDGNTDLRRILTDYGFQGHPLRKDFPLSGFIELYYNERLNSIVYQPVSLVQEYRHFDTLSPWDWIPKDQINFN